MPTGIPTTAGDREKHAGCPTPNKEKNAGASLNYLTTATEVTVLTPLQYTKRCSSATASASGSPTSNPDRRDVHRTLPNVTNGCLPVLEGSRNQSEFRTWEATPSDDLDARAAALSPVGAGSSSGAAGSTSTKCTDQYNRPSQLRVVASHNAASPLFTEELGSFNSAPTARRQATGSGKRRPSVRRVGGC